MLEKRVKTLEKQNIEISKNLNYVGNNEPARPVFQQRKVKRSSHVYEGDSEQDEWEDQKQEQISKSLQKVQSTPAMKHLQV